MHGESEAEGHAVPGRAARPLHAAREVNSLKSAIPALKLGYGVGTPVVPVVVVSR